MITVEAGSPDEVLDLEKAKEVGDTLCKFYPDHPWVVSFQGRVLVVRHMDIAWEVRKVVGKGGFGFMLKHLDSYSASQLAHNAMLAGGELLEAFGLPRGKNDGRAPVVPANWGRQTARYQ